MAKFRMLDYEEVRKFILALSVVAYAFAIYDFFYPRTPSGSGRWGWLLSFLYEQFGSYSISVLWVIIGTILLVFFARKRT